jgi:hypothetical protein
VSMKTMVYMYDGGEGVPPLVIPEDANREAVYVYGVRNRMLFDVTFNLPGSPIIVCYSDNVGHYDFRVRTHGYWVQSEIIVQSDSMGAATLVVITREG